MVFKKRNKVGLDLGTAAIKVINIELQDNRLLLRKFIFRDIPRLNPDIPSLLKDSLAELGTQNTTISISLSGPNVVTRYISLPIMTEKEFKNAIRFEAGKYIPFSIDEVNLDGYILKQDPAAHKMSVLIAAAKKEFVDQHIRLIQDLGFKIGVLDIDSLALVNAFNFNYSGDETLKLKTTALLNIGAKMTNLNILEESIPCLSRDIQIGGDNFTDKIVDDLGVDFKAAEGLKIDSNKETCDRIKTSIETVLSQMANEIRSSFDYYESQSVSSVEKIFITGGGSLLMGFVDNLSHLLGIEIKSWDPLNNFEFTEGSEVEKIKERSAQLAVAVGLALR